MDYDEEMDYIMETEREILEEENLLLTRSKYSEENDFGILEEQTKLEYKLLPQEAIQLLKEIQTLEKRRENLQNLERKVYTEYELLILTVDNFNVQLKNNTLFDELYMTINTALMQRKMEYKEKYDETMDIEPLFFLLHDE